MKVQDLGATKHDTSDKEETKNDDQTGSNKNLLS